MASRLALPPPVRHLQQGPQPSRNWSLGFFYAQMTKEQVLIRVYIGDVHGGIGGLGISQWEVKGLQFRAQV